MISARYAAPTAILLALALVPTTMHTYMGAVAVDGLTAKAVPPVLQGFTSSDTARRAAWVESNFESVDWIERVYRTPLGSDVTLFVGRSYDAKRLYHHPELALLRGMETSGAGVVRAKARPDVPLHLLRVEQNGRSGVGVYALLYEGRYIADPVWFQLRTAAENVFGRRAAMTLFLASDLSGDPARIDAAPATRVLLAAIEGFETQKR